MSVKYPRVCIEFCTACKWNLRAAWYAQEILSTFGNSIGEVSLSPSSAGKFLVTVVSLDDDNKKNTVILWDRKTENGFPDSKELKQRLRNVIDPKKSLGHVDKHSNGDGKLKSSTEFSSATVTKTNDNTEECKDCKDC